MSKDTSKQPNIEHQPARSSSKGLDSMSQAEKLQHFITSADFSNLESMSQTEKLQYILSSKEFMASMAAGLLMNRNTGIDEVSPMLSASEQMDIQKKLSLYDRTLKETLDAIKSGKLKDEQVFVSQKSIHNVGISRNKTQPTKSMMTKNINGNEIEVEFTLHNKTPDTLKDVPENFDYEVELEDSLNCDYDNDFQYECTCDSHSYNLDNCSSSYDNQKTADEYIEQMVKFINQNKKFDNFLDEVSKLESIDKKQQKQINQNRNNNQKIQKTVKKAAKNDDFGTTSCELTFEYGKDGELLNTGPDDILKRRINTQIIKALESFKLDDALEEDIANAIAKSLENSDGIFHNPDDEFDERNNIPMHSSDKIEIIDEQVKSSNLGQEVVQSGQENICDHSDRHMEEPDINHSKKLKKKKKKSKSTIDPRKQPKRKTIAVPRSQIHGDIHSNWVCEFCEYEHVYGEKPIFLMKWFNKKLHEQEQRDSYQRQRLRRSRQSQQEKRRQMSQQQQQEQFHQHQQIENYQQQSSEDLDTGVLPPLPHDEDITF